MSANYASVCETCKVYRWTSRPKDGPSTPEHDAFRAEHAGHEVTLERDDCWYTAFDYGGYPTEDQTAEERFAGFTQLEPLPKTAPW